MKTNREKNVLISAEDIDNYPIYTGSSKRRFPRTVGDIEAENREWYDQLVASLTGEISDDMNKEGAE